MSLSVARLEFPKSPIDLTLNLLDCERYITTITSGISLSFQSASALEFVKKDLVEFSSTMKTDSVTVADQVKSKLNVSPTQLTK